MPEQRKRLRKEVRLNPPKGSTGVRGSIPAEVRDRLGAGAGDVLIFEEGSASVAERAALEGIYFVVTLRRERTAVSHSAHVAPEPFTESVKKYRELKDEERIIRHG